jgi:hypothetical protein
LGRIDKGVKCSVEGCGNMAVRSISIDKVASAGLKIREERRAYLCETHYKEFKKKTRKQRTLEKWRWKG